MRKLKTIPAARIEDDIVIVIQDQPGCEDNEGLVVRVSDPLLLDRYGRPAWLISPLTPEPCLYGEPTGVYKFAYFQRGDIEHSDMWLLPNRCTIEGAKV